MLLTCKMERHSVAPLTDSLQCFREAISNLLACIRRPLNAFIQMEIGINVFVFSISVGCLVSLRSPSQLNSLADIHFNQLFSPTGDVLGSVDHFHSQAARTHRRTAAAYPTACTAARKVLPSVNGRAPFAVELSYSCPERSILYQL